MLCHDTIEPTYGTSIPGIATMKTMACIDQWNIILRRGNTTVSFERTWIEYAQGFGDPLEDHWMGNQVI